MKKILILIFLLNCNINKEKILNKYKNDNFLTFIFENDDVNLLKIYLAENKINDHQIVTLAAREDALECLTYLIDKGFKVKKNIEKIDFSKIIKSKKILITASIKEEILESFFENKFEKVIFLLDKIYNNQDEMNFNAIKDEKGNNLFHLCIMNKKYDFLKAILEKYKNYYINEINQEGNTPLHLLVEENLDIDLIKFLVENGALININNKIGENAASILFKSRDIKVIKKALELVSNIPLYENLREHINFFTEDLLKSFFDKNVSFKKCNVNDENFSKNFYYFVGSTLNMKKDYLENKKEFLEIILMTVFLDSFEIDDMDFKDYKPKENEITSGYKAVPLDWWKKLIEQQYVKDEDYHSKKDLEKRKEYFLKKVSRIDNEAGGKSPLELFKTVEGAKLAKEGLQKLYQLISKSPDISELLIFSISTLVKGFKKCQARILFSINESLVYSSQSNFSGGFESWIHFQIYNYRHFILNESIKKFIEDLDSMDHVKLFIMKQLNFISLEVQDNQFTDQEMEEILRRENRKQSIINYFHQNYKERIINILMDNMNNDKLSENIFDYFTAHAGSIYINELDELIFENFIPKRNVLISLLSSMGYLEVRGFKKND